MLIKSLLAFLAGGLICSVAEILIDKTRLTPARILVSYVVVGIFIDAIGIYTPLFNLFGCGISLPLIGFGGAVGTGVREAVDSFGMLGILRGPFTAMSAGATLALLLGFFASIFFRGKPKKM